MCYSSDGARSVGAQQNAAGQLRRNVVLHQHLLEVGQLEFVDEHGIVRRNAVLVERHQGQHLFVVLVDVVYVCV